jgi:hypothetical protein
MFKKKKNFYLNLLHPKLLNEYWILLQRYSQAEAKTRLVKKLNSERLPRVLQSGSLVSIGKNKVWLEIYAEDLVRIRSKLKFIIVDDLSNLPIDKVFNTKKDSKNEK